ncbi:MAG: efflux transporter outer rane subunit [Sphingomonadales bacterium]|nr:efflux transporter outer rane subunit [Sphingomonadales bacterium]
MNSQRGVFCSVLLATVSGCAFGPVHPQTDVSLPASIEAVTSTAQINPASGPAQTIVVGPQVAKNWWTAFGNADLNALVESALKHNNDIQTADAALRQAAELGRAASGARLPTLDLNYQAERARVSDALATPLFDPNQTLYTLHTAQVTVGYAFDVFGGTRSKILSARAAAEVQRNRFEAARTTVIANMVLAVIQTGSIKAQIAAATQNIASNAELLTMMRRRQQLGSVGALDVATQETALASAEGALPPLQHSFAHQQAVISVLAGNAPGTPLMPIPDLAALALPRSLPVSLPSDLVRRRPDVQAAEAQMRGAGADVGTAIAARLPAIQLSATAGGVATDFAQMFATGNPFWTLIGGITQPLFHGGALRHQQRAAEAALDGAKSQYRASVLQAFVDVSDALNGLRTDADALDAASRASDAAGRTLHYVKRQLELGDVGTLTLLNASAANAQASLQLIQSRAARLSDSVALFQAMGGDWQSRTAGTAN